MSDDFADAQAAAIEALRDYGEPLLIQRRSSAYDPATRQRAAGVTQSQTLQARVDVAGKGNSRIAGTDIRTFERIATISPDGMIFEPAVGDYATVEGALWRIGEGGIEITRGGGLVIVMRAGLVSA